MTDNFITPAEARELVTTSEQNVARYLKRASEEIRKAAEAGKRSIDFYMNDSNERLAFEVSSWNKPRPSTLQQLIIDNIRKKGFGCEFKASGEQYVPRGLADDDGNGPMHQNWNIVISW